MPAFKEPGLHERQKAAARAKSAALAKFHAKPPIDEAVMAERTVRRLAVEAAEAEKRAAVRHAKEAAAEAKSEQERQAAAAAEAAATAEAEAAAQAEADAAAQKKPWTEADRKAARDARYASRKMRNGRR